MKARVTVLTLGVADLERAVAFYRDGLKFATEGIIGQEFEHGAVAFFDLESGMKLALWRREDIAYDSGVQAQNPNPAELTLGHNVSSKLEVDQVMQEVESAGGTVVKSPHDTFWGGYSGYFQDPDGHLWEVVWNPELSI
ncbi:VOC family protein [Listeria aquatica]|uniref:Lactoylglutathione lyase n=1 Tax=Listeria aquatica FSL S10-1188 TaxID=1265818 RepID=W7BF74_9LIST|nr:VOC family protein [Listeria aquatica]EUJ21796.1 lactoylglutathione lyase [Listeria aquatica FSL S10-1188]